MATILEEAIQLTSHDRADDYGHPLDHHQRTAGMITSLIKHKLKPGEEITYRDWERFIICDKLARDENKPKRDNETDIAGYARTMEMAREEEELRAKKEGVNKAVSDTVYWCKAHGYTATPCTDHPIPDSYGLPNV